MLLLEELKSLELTKDILIVCSEGCSFSLIFLEIQNRCFHQQIAQNGVRKGSKTSHRPTF